MNPQIIKQVMSEMAKRSVAARKAKHGKNFGEHMRQIRAMAKVKKVK